MKKLHYDAVAFLLIIILLGAANALNFNKPRISELENRKLREKPKLTLSTLLSGDYFHDYEEYYSDTFILRDWMVRSSRDLRKAMSLGHSGVELIVTHEPGQVQGGNEGGNPAAPIGNDADSRPANDTKNGNTGGENETGNGTTASSNVSNITGNEGSGSGSEHNEEGSSNPKQEEPPKKFDEDRNAGYWLIIDGKAVQLFKFNKEGMSYYSEVLNKYREKIGDDVKMYSLIAPTASEFIKLRKYKGITDSQNDAMDFLRSKLDSSIKSVNVYDALNKHKDEYIYFKTDHHWTALGAYYAYAAFMELKGETPVPLEKYEERKIEGFLGSSYTKTLNKELEKNPDTIYVYMPFTNYKYEMYYGDKCKEAEVIDMSYAEGKDKYLVFLSSGGATWSVIKTDIKNGKKLLVMKDSYGNTFVPFLLPHYEEIYVVDSRFYSKYSTGKNIVEFIKDNGINEMLFVHYMEDVNWKKFMEDVEKHLE
ncbi:MAG TPA: hypothetical protein GXX36_04405 [Clostridiaceae bacterium]|nr:hypothetical protein [Clostridiaceae bacterium]